MGNAPGILERLREWGVAHRKEIVFAFIIFLVSSLSFALGYLANRESVRVPIIIEKNNN